MWNSSDVVIYQISPISCSGQSITEIRYGGVSAGERLPWSPLSCLLAARCTFKRLGKVGQDGGPERLPVQARIEERGNENKRHETHPLPRTSNELLSLPRIQEKKKHRTASLVVAMTTEKRSRRIPCRLACGSLATATQKQGTHPEKSSWSPERGITAGLGYSSGFLDNIFTKKTKTWRRLHFLSLIPTTPVWNWR